MSVVERPSNLQWRKWSKGNTTSFHQQRICQGQTRLCMVEVSWILTLILQLQEPIDVYFSILENSVMYYHIVTTIKLEKFIPIINSVTTWKSPETGQTYIFVLHEDILTGDTLDHTLVNQNQLRHYGTRVQDNPMSKISLSIITEDGEFSM